jgi:hypothetical protein
MNANDLPKDIAQTAIQQDLMGAVRAIAQGPLAKRAQSIDQEGLYPQDLLQQLAAVGGMSAHLDQPGKPGDYKAAIAAMAEVGKVCGASAFMMWCQACAACTCKHRATPPSPASGCKATCRAWAWAAPACPTP